MGKRRSKKKGSKLIEKQQQQQGPMFNIRCTGREMLRMDLRCLYESEELYEFLEEIDEARKENDPDPRFDLDERNIGSIQEIQSPKHIVSLVNDFCVGRVEIVETYADKDVDLCLEKLREFHAEFFRDKPISILVLLLNAAIQLKIQSLMDLVCKAIVDMHNLKSADEIFKIFNVGKEGKHKRQSLLVYDELEMSDCSTNND